MQTINDSTVTTNGQTTVKNGKDGVAVNEMTSKDYYFDSYAHFGIHEVSESKIDFFFFSKFFQI